MVSTMNSVSSLSTAKLLANSEVFLEKESNGSALWLSALTFSACGNLDDGETLPDELGVTKSPVVSGTGVFNCTPVSKIPAGFPVSE